MDQNKDQLDQIDKSITGATQAVVTRLRKQILSPNSLLFPFINKINITAGRTLYPFIDTISENATRFTIGSLDMDKTTDFTIAEVTNETREDSNPAIGMDAAIQNCLDIQMVKKIEKKVVDALIADTNVHLTMTLNWEGIRDGIEALGGDVFSISGTIYVGVNLTRYLAIIEQDSFVNAMKMLNDKVRLVVVEQFADNQMLVMHEHGVAGGLKAKELEQDPQPGLDRIDYIAPFTYAFGWDPKYVKFSN